MANNVSMSRRTRNNWLINAAVSGGALVTGLSGVYYLFWPSGGQGTYNLTGSTTVLFVRHTWEDLHLWGGLAMIVAVTVHLIIHWSWVKMMGRRTIMAIRGQGAGLSRGGRINVLVDLAIGISFLLVAVSGLYFLFGTSGGYQGGRNPAWDPGFLFSRTTWDLIHTWAGVVMFNAASLHFWIHWRWIVNTSRKFLAGLAWRASNPWRQGARVESRAE
jgi:hypothetical protein